MTDDRIISIIAESFDVIEPTPADALHAALDAFAFRDLDSRLAELTFDSWSTEPAVAMRGPRTDARVLSFEWDQVALDIELDGGGGAMLLGQISPPTAGPIDVESLAGVTLTVSPDDHGRFRVLSVPAGNLRLRVATGVHTPWIIR